MKISASFLFLIAALQACSQKPSRSPGNVLDTSINKLVLLNSVNIRENIGDQTGKIIEDEKASRVLVSNSDSTEFLTLFHLDGSNINTFNQFEVNIAREIGYPLQIVSDRSFVTESGIRLGMSQEQLTAIKGTGTVQKHNNKEVIISYKIKSDKDPILLKYDMPIYEASYYFKNNKLIKFVFGFPNL